MDIDFFRINIPLNWSTEEDDEGYSFFEGLNGVGVLKISPFIVDNYAELNLFDELIDFSSSILPNSPLEHLVKKMDDNFYYIDKILVNGRMWKIAMKANQGRVLIVTYNCKEKDSEHKEVGEINNIIIHGLNFL